MPGTARASVGNICYHIINRGSPFGDNEWTKRIAAKLNLECTISPRGRPPKKEEKLNVPVSAFSHDNWYKKNGADQGLAA
jgi:hypothetical protein